MLADAALHTDPLKLDNTLITCDLFDARYEQALARTHPAQHVIRGQILVLLGRPEQARAEFAAAVAEQRAALAKNSMDTGALGDLALALAGLHRFADARREGLQALELLPIARDPDHAPEVIERMALIDLQSGREEETLDRLEYLLTIPGPLSQAWLRGHPFWATLRSNPGFQRLTREGGAPGSPRKPGAS